MVAGGREVALDPEGHLADPSLWDREVAVALAASEQIELSSQHWELIELAREFYRRFEHPPAMRALVTFVRKELGADKGNSIWLMRHFPESPARRLARIAGLPRPDKCF